MPTDDQKETEGQTRMGKRSQSRLADGRTRSRSGRGEVENVAMAAHSSEPLFYVESCAHCDGKNDSLKEWFKNWIIFIHCL